MSDGPKEIVRPDAPRMWTRCPVCSADLGRNREVEHFQVGDRLAYDPERGRLWVICPKCSRWSLTPLEIRWEALEELERIWERTSAKVRGEKIALARTRSGLRIVRVGTDPAERELAIWRWGTRIRPWRHNLPLVGTAGVVGGAAAGLLIAPQAALLGLGTLAYVGALAALTRLGGGVPVTLDRAGDVTTLSRNEIRNAGMNPADDELGWSIHLERPTYETKPSRFFGQVERTGSRQMRWIEFTGDDALSIARRAFPLLNRRYSREGVIGDAIELVAAAGGPEGYLRHAAAEKPRWVKFAHYPEPLRLSLEMVLFQEEERRALAGELERLEEAWQEAETVAGIHDSLLPPGGWYQFRRDVRERRGEPRDPGPAGG